MVFRRRQVKLVPPNQKLRIALSIGQLGRGGAEGQLALLTEQFVDRGHEVHVVTLYGGGALEKRFRDAGANLFYCHFPTFRSHLDGRLDSSFSPLDLLLLPRTSIQIAIAFIRYVRWLRQTRPHVVMAFLFYAYVTSAFAARIARVAVVVAGRRSLGNFKEGRRILLLAERLANLLTDTVVANSNAVRLDVLDQEKLSPSKVRVIHNGLPSTAFEGCRVATSSGPGKPRIVCVANFRGYKGHSYLLEALALLKNSGQDTSLLLVGDGFLEPEIRETVRRHQLDVVFSGSTSNVRPLLQSADIFVLPSLEEGFSNALLEAMAVGLPIVATDVGGNGEALKETGLLVRPKDIMALANAITSLIEDPARAAGLGQSARERAQSEFKAEMMASQYIDLFHDLLSARKWRAEAK